MHEDVYLGGRHELGQNFLVDPAVIGAVERLVARTTTGPIVEIGAGDGALTRSLSRLGRPVTAIEIDPVRARRLADRLPRNVEVVCADVLRHRFPRRPHTIVGNVPFHLATPILRRLLVTGHWQDAVLLVQWEVARRRAGVGGASMLTASWWPWFEFDVHGRIPARAFRPVPSVDGGLLAMRRRAAPLVEDRHGYQAFVAQVFTGRGRGLAEVVLRTGQVGRHDLRVWLRETGISAHALPKDLNAEEWAWLWALAAPSAGRSPAIRRPS
jgi:23S rRNA (adenine-N6)-dimethyltransferase